MRFPSTHWLPMGLGGRIPPLLGEAIPRDIFLDTAPLE